MQHSEGGLELTRIILEIFRANGRLLMAGDALMKDIGLTSARWQVMGVIADTPHDVTVSMIARLVGLQRQSVQRVADLLVQEGQVAYFDNPHHQRAKVVRLTKAGQDLYREARRRQVKWANSLARQLKAHEFHATVELLRDLRAKLGDSSSPMLP